MAKATYAQFFPPQNLPAMVQFVTQLPESVSWVGFARSSGDDELDWGAAAWLLWDYHSTRFEGR